MNSSGMAHDLDSSNIERVGDGFAMQRMLEVRQLTRSVIHEIAAAVEPGMIEEDAVKLARRILASKKMLRSWHGIFVRFGRNTTKTVNAPSDPGVVLGESDIFLIDIGPVVDQIEGDGGDTFVVGTDPEHLRCAADARALFHRVRHNWLAKHATGRRLYEFAAQQAREMGWDLNMDWSGHRISDFPHAAYYSGLLADIDFCPSPSLWVLEIHIRHPSKPFGAFFEDLLLDDSYFAS
jgi:methionine aminopeptidase